MLPKSVEDIITNLLDRNKHPEMRQHYERTLIEIVKQGQEALDKFETERHFKK